MDKYISCEAAINKLLQCADGYDPDYSDITVAHAVSKIKEVPAADVVDVVRCKDCKHGKGWANADIKRTTYSCSLLGRTHLEHLYNSCRGFLGSADLSGNFFCAYGERRDGNG